MTYQQKYSEACERLRQSGVEEWELDARYLLYHVTGFTSAEWLLRRWDEMPEEQQAGYDAVLVRREQREPLQYIVGTQEFMGLEFKVSPAVLIPRQDTETLVELALPHCAGRRVLDLCTGSGCIAVSIGVHGSPATLTASDCSEAALCMARANAKRHEIGLTLVQSDLFEQVEGHFDVIVSNPPYVAETLRTKLSPEVVLHEPSLALFAGPEGMDLYERIVPGAVPYLREGAPGTKGILLLEIGMEQGEMVSRLMQAHGYENVTVHRDYCGKDRVVYGELVR